MIIGFISAASRRVLVPFDVYRLPKKVPRTFFVHMAYVKTKWNCLQILRNDLFKRHDYPSVNALIFIIFGPSTPIIGGFWYQSAMH